MMNSKKGLSDIVTNVLIILLVLVAVGIIWAFLQPTISSGAGQLGGAGDCLTVQVEPVSCNVAVNPADTTVEVRRGAGSGDLQGLSIIATDPNTNQAGVSSFTDSADLLNELETKDYTVTATSDTIITVAPIVADGEGGTRTCNENPVSVTCE